MTGRKENLRFLANIWYLSVNSPATELNVGVRLIGRVNVRDRVRVGVIVRVRGYG